MHYDQGWAENEFANGSLKTITAKSDTDQARI